MHFGASQQEKGDRRKGPGHPGIQQWQNRWHFTPTVGRSRLSLNTFSTFPGIIRGLREEWFWEKIINPPTTQQKTKCLMAAVLLDVYGNNKNSLPLHRIFSFLILCQWQKMLNHKPEALKKKEKRGKKEVFHMQKKPVLHHFMLPALLSGATFLIFSLF